MNFSFRIVGLLRIFPYDFIGTLLQDQAFSTTVVNQMLSSSEMGFQQPYIQSKCFAIRILLAIFDLDGGQESIRSFNTIFQDKALHRLDHAVVRSLQWLASERRFLKLNRRKHAFFHFQQLGKIHNSHHQNCSLFDGSISRHFKYPHLQQKIIAFLQQGLNRDPSASAVFFVLSALYTQRNLNNKSNRCLEILMQRHPEQKAYLLYKYAQNLFQLHEEQKALNCIKQAQSIALSQPNEKWQLSLNLRILRVKIYRFQKKIRWAYLQLQLIIQKNQLYEPAYRTCIEHYLLDQAYNKFVALMREYKRLFPESKKILGLITYAKVLWNITSEIMKDIDEIVQREGKSSRMSIKISKWIAFVYYKQYKFQKALEYFQQVEHYYKKDVQFIVLYATCNFKVKRYMEAIKHFWKAETIFKKYNSDNNKWRIFIAKAYVELGEKEEALQIANAELDRDECTLDEYFMLAQLYSKLNYPSIVFDMIDSLKLEESALQDSRIQIAINIKFLKYINYKKVGDYKASLQMYHQINEIFELIGIKSFTDSYYFKLINFLIHCSFEYNEFQNGKNLLIRKMNLINKYYQYNECERKHQQQLLRERKCEEILQ